MAGGWTDWICDPVRPRADAAGVQLRSITVASMIDSFMNSPVNEDGGLLTSPATAVLDIASKISEVHEGICEAIVS